MIARLIPCAVVALAAGTAQAAFLSFASDTADRAWTFTGNGATITNGTGPTNPIVLHVDDNNGQLPRLDVSTNFTANMTLSYVASVPLGGGAFSHNYLASGTFSFVDILSGVTLLQTTFSNALYTARGGQSSWFTTGALQADSFGGAVVNMIWGGASLPGYGLAPGAVVSHGFAFDLTVVNTSGAIPYNFQNPGVALGTNFLPSTTWFSESSFSAGVLPTPGTVSLMGLAGLAILRRRRR
jgi:uncharacterized protein (TIGR03382 family)